MYYASNLSPANRGNDRIIYRTVSLLALIKKNLRLRSIHPRNIDHLYKFIWPKVWKVEHSVWNHTPELWDQTLSLECRISPNMQDYVSFSILQIVLVHHSLGTQNHCHAARVNGWVCKIGNWVCCINQHHHVQRNLMVFKSKKWTFDFHINPHK